MVRKKEERIGTLEPEPGSEPEVASLCATCLKAYPHCGGDSVPGFTTENGAIIGCGGYQNVAPSAVAAEPGPAAEAEPGAKPGAEPKPVPARLAEKRKAQTASQG